MRTVALLALALVVRPLAAEPARIEVHEWFSAMTFTADGRFLAGASDQGLVTWDLPTGVKRTLVELTDDPLALEAGPGPGEVTLVDSAGRVRRFAAGTALDPEARVEAPEAMEGAPQVLALAKGGGVQVVWDEGRKVLEVRGGGGGVTIGGGRTEAPEAARISADGKVLVVPGEDALEVFSATDGRLLGLLPDPSGDGAFAVSPAGERIATWSERTVWFWEPSGDAVWGRMAHEGSVERLVFTRDGKRALSGTDGGDVVFWDLEARSSRRMREKDDAVIRALALAPDGVMVAIQADDFIELWCPPRASSAPPQRVVTVPLELEHAEGGPLAPMPGLESRGRVSRSGAISDLAVAADGGLWVALDEGALMRVTADGSEEDQVLEEAGPGLRVAASPAGTWTAFGGATTALHRLLPGEDAKPQPLAGVPAPVYALVPVAGSPNLAVAGPDGLTLVAPEKGGKVGAVPMKGVAIRSLAGFPGGGKLAVGGDDGKVRLVDAAAGRETKAFQAHQGSVSALAVSPDGRFLATASTGLLDRTVKLFELASGAEKLRLVGHPRPPGAVGFSADGKYLVLAGGPDSLLFWDLAAGRYAGYLETMPEDQGVLAIGAKGEVVASGSTEGVAEHWGPPGGDQ